MFSASLPFDYLQHLDRHDRVRRTPARFTGSRVRRPLREKGVTT
jgi:hypothetical protein